MIGDFSRGQSGKVLRMVCFVTYVAITAHAHVCALSDINYAGWYDEYRTVYLPVLYPQHKSPQLVLKTSSADTLNVHDGLLISTKRTFSTVSTRIVGRVLGEAIIIVNTTNSFITAGSELALKSQSFKHPYSPIVDYYNSSYKTSK